MRYSKQRELVMQTVQQLCEALHTSESTIRRDLTELDRQGRLTKVHGGATLPDSRFLADEPTMEAKETLAVAEKRSIAAAAAALITAEDFVFIDAGTTTLELVRALTGPSGLLSSAVTSEIWGIFSMRQTPSTRRAAGMMATAAFFAPLMCTSPKSG